MEQWDVDSLTFEESGRGQKVAALLIAEFLSVALVYVTPRRVKRSPSFPLSARSLRSRREKQICMIRAFTLLSINYSLNILITESVCLLRRRRYNALILE